MRGVVFMWIFHKFPFLRWNSSVLEPFLRVFMGLGVFTVFGVDHLRVQRVRPYCGESLLKESECQRTLLYFHLQIRGVVRPLEVPPGLTKVRCPSLPSRLSRVTTPHLTFLLTPVTNVTVRTFRTIDETKG